MNENKNTSVALENKSLAQWLSYLESIHPSEIDMGLGRTKQVAERLGLSLSSSTVITVAGTNGKGTTCRFIEQALLAQGKSVAVYSSPHLVDYRERVRLNGALPEEAAFCNAFREVEIARGEISLTYFEFGTLAGMKMMQDWHVDVAILEVGLGGRLDATNIISPDLAVITTIGLDHQDWLGDTREKIAVEKAGILRDGIKAVIGELDPPTTLVSEVERFNAKALWANKDFFVDNASADDWQWRCAAMDKSLSGLRFPSIPLQNVSTAIAALRHIDLLPDEDTLRALTQTVSMPGRQQVLSDSPPVVVDVAHNPQATENLTRWIDVISERHGAKNLRFVVGMLKDKAIEETLAPLTKFSGCWYVADTHGSRGCNAQVLQDALSRANVAKEDVFKHSNVLDAFSAANNDYKEGDLIVVFGSFLTVADVLAQHSAESE